MAEDKRTTVISINIDNGAAIKRIANLSREIETNKQHVKDLRKSLKELDDTSDDYAEQVQAIHEEIAATNAQSTEYKRTVSELNRVVANSVRESQEQEGSLKSLRAELSRLSSEYDSLGKAQREGLEGTELRDRIASITEEIKDSEEATGRFQRNVGNYENAIRDVLGVNDGFASSIMGLSDNMSMANGIIPGLKGGVISLGTALKSLLTNPAFLIIAGISKVGVALSFWANYNKGLSEATRLTEQFTGLAGGALENYRDTVQAVADAYGKDFKEVLESANAIAKQFEISFSDAITVIKDGFVAGADVSEDFLSNISEYSTFFREAGLSASEFVAISAETAKMGIYSDKGVDAIKEATIRLREMTTATEEALAGIGLSGEEIQQALTDGSMTAFEAIQMVSGRISELPEMSREVGTAVADIFGGPGEDAGVRYISTLKNISTDLDVVKGKSGEYAQMQDDLLRSEIELEKASNQLFGGMALGLDAVNTKFKTWLNEVLTKIYRDTIKFGGELSGTWAMLKTLGDETVKTFVALGEVLKNLFTLNFEELGNSWANFTEKNSKIILNSAKAYQEAYNSVVNREVEEPVSPATNPTVSTTTNTTTEPIVIAPTTTQVDNELERLNDEREKALKELAEYEAQLRQIIIDNTYTEVEQINARYDAEIAALQASYDANVEYAENAKALEEQKNAAIIALNEARNKEIEEANQKSSAEALRIKAEEYARMRQEDALELLQLRLSKATQKDILLAEERQINEQLNALKRENYETTLEYETAKTELQIEASDVRRQIIEAEAQHNAEVQGAMQSLFSSLGELIVATSKDEEEAARRGKIIALAEIAVNTGEAISQGVVSAMAVPFPANLAAIVSTIAAVLSNMATAITTVKSAKFATGGLVTGEGTSTSDSIPALLSNGESVMTAAATSMFSPVLSAFNQMGGGVPITAVGSNSALGEEMLARAFARGVASMPNPVVDVQEITRVANRVRVLEDMARV